MNMLIPPFCSLHLADFCLQNDSGLLKLSKLQIQSNPDQLSIDIVPKQFLSSESCLWHFTSLILVLN